VNASELARRLELTEALAWTELHQGQSLATKQALGVAVRHYGSATALFTSGIDELAVNRVIGVGLDAGDYDAGLHQIISDYRAAGCRRMLVQIAPVSANAARVQGALRDWGPREVRPTVKLYRRATPECPAGMIESSIQVVQIDAASARLFEQTVARELGIPAPLRSMTASTAGHPNWRHYLALANGTPIAGAALYTHDDTAWFGLAATLPHARGRGAQSTLLVKRIHDAFDAGCTWVTADTLAETLQSPNTSLRNMRRLGFEIAYERANHLLDLTAQPAQRFNDC